MRLLLDTNVWLDNYIPDRPNHQLVGSLLTNAIKQQHDLLYALPSAKDVFYLIGHAYKQMARMEGDTTEATASAINEIAWACVDNMADLACAVGADASDVWMARKYKALHRDFEDDLVLAAAVRANVDYLVTSDERLIRKAPVAALAPGDMLDVLLLFER